MAAIKRARQDSTHRAPWIFAGTTPQTAFTHAASYSVNANITSISTLDYLSALYQNTTMGDLVFTAKGKKVAAVFSVSEIQDAAQSIENYEGTDLYLKINVMNHERNVARIPHGVGGVKEVCAIIGFHLDIDCEKSGKYPSRDEALAALDTMPMRPAIIIYTNGDTGGFHAY